MWIGMGQDLKGTVTHSQREEDFESLYVRISTFPNDWIQINRRLAKFYARGVLIVIYEGHPLLDTILFVERTPLIAWCTFVHIR